MGFENSFYFVYVLFSESDDKHYIGYTHNLPLRFEQHIKGQVPSTKNRRPLKLIYFEACLNQQDATRREKYLPRGINLRFNAKRYSIGLKTHYGRMFIKKRLQNYYAN